MLPNNPRQLSAKYQCDFAYSTVKDRLPVIITKVIDTVSRLKNDVSSENKEEMWNDLKEIVSRLSMVKYEMLRDKPLAGVSDDNEDVPIWTEYQSREEQVATPRWFQTSWLYAECYFYRKIAESFFLSSYHKKLDPFLSEKRNAYQSSLPATSTLINYLHKTLVDLKHSEDPQHLRSLFNNFLEVSLWGNKCDLSISAMAENLPEVNLISQLASLQPHILVNHTDSIWRQLKQADRVDIVLDNAGFEFVTDLCLAKFLLDAKLARHIHMHVKCMPWFVSDVTRQDFDWTLEQLRTSAEPPLSQLAENFKKYLTEKRVIITEEPFWTLPHDFSFMKTVAPHLYAEFNNSDMIIFKGDLNYRKLTGDRKWPFRTEFQRTLGGFQPAPFCTLRTCKSDLVVGLDTKQAADVEAIDMAALVSGNLAFIQFSSG